MSVNGSMCDMNAPLPRTEMAHSFAVLRFALSCLIADLTTRRRNR